MLNKKIAQALTKGLLTGYAGGKVSSAQRDAFFGDASHVELENGDVYHDEWFVASHLGGGQELVKVDGQMFTRLYAGGTPLPEKLAELGVTTKDVGAYLKQKITELGERTRLDADCLPAADGDWRYEYTVLLNDEKIGMVVGVESIYYKNERVHLHPFILSAVQ